MANPRNPNQQLDEQRITGVDFTEVRTGEDTRQRGWFWHWNELHTEYEPLLKHSGIGLITSYIVWTDRREHSPYRGYAFPSLGTNWTSTPGSLGVNTYSWSGAPAAPGTKSVTATNNAALTSTNGSFR